MLTEKELNNFNSKIKKVGACQEWQGCLNRDGYGKVNIRRLGATTYAHRISYRHYLGEVQEGLHVCHTCDNPKCVNPDHLFLGTAQDNMSDMINKDRHVIVDQRGERNGHSKLTKEDVLKIKELLSIYNNKEIASMFNVTHSTISCIRVGKTWRHI